MGAGQRCVALQFGIVALETRELIRSVGGHTCSLGRPDAKSGTEIKGMTSEVTGVKWDPTHPEHLASCSAASSAASGSEYPVATLFKGIELSPPPSSPLF